jgi:hypothetical protein
MSSALSGSPGWRYRYGDIHHKSARIAYGVVPAGSSSGRQMTPSEVISWGVD